MRMFKQSNCSARAGLGRRQDANGQRQGYNSASGTVRDLRATTVRLGNCLHKR
jgi:hypothetical protein